MLGVLFAREEGQHPVVAPRSGRQAGIPVEHKHCRERQRPNPQ